MGGFEPVIESENITHNVVRSSIDTISNVRERKLTF